MCIWLDLQEITERQRRFRIDGRVYLERHSVWVMKTDPQPFVAKMSFHNLLHNAKYKKWSKSRFAFALSLLTLGSEINTFFLHPYKVRHCLSHRRRRGSALTLWAVKYCDKHPSSVFMDPSVKIFNKWLDQVWKEILSHLSM